MAYKNIVFIKLEKRLLNDWRFYMMSEQSQLNYCRLLMLAGETYNKIPLNEKAIRQAFRTSQTSDEIEKSLKEIQRNFPKFKNNKNFYYFDEFETKTNWVSPQQSPGNRRAIAKQATDIEKEEDIDKRKRKRRNSPLSDQEFIDSLKTNPAYKGIDIDREFSKMDAWLAAHPRKKKSRGFVVNWLNRIDHELPKSNGQYLTKAQQHTVEGLKRLEEKYGHKDIPKGVISDSKLLS